MAMTPEDREEEAAVTEFKPQPPDPKTLDYEQVVLSYDRECDTLFAHFYGRGRDAESILIGDSAYWLVDVDSDDIVGLQIEDFLAREVRRYPWMIEALDVAELHGIDRAEVQRLRNEIIHGLPRKLTASVRRRVEPVSRRKRTVIDRIVEKGLQVRAAAAF